MNHSAPEPSKKVNLGGTISLVVSMILHLTATLVLSWIIIGQHGANFNGISLDGTQLDDSTDAQTPTLEISAAESLQTDEETEQTLIEAPKLPLQLTNPVASSTSHLVSPSPSTVSQEVARALAMGGGSEESENEGGGATQGSSDSPGASFFGTRAYGNRFVFVIDSSTSMIGPRWEALRLELNRALRSLSPDQEFFVISFDSTAHPMFGGTPPYGKFLKPTEENIARLNRWVSSINHVGATQPASAVGIALRLEPDAIFLLSDGEIRDATLFDLRTYNRFEDNAGSVKVTVPIHTVLLFSNVGYLTLKAIADENDGVFTPVTSFRGLR